MGAVGLDIGKWFVFGAVGLGVAVALLLRFTRKSD
jgi:formate-dependent nitrite reductase membrane component NrfD